MSGHNIRLLALDLDGTTLRSSAVLSSAVKKAIQYAVQRQVLVVPCTGRALGSLPEEIAKLPGIIYAVTSNGASVTHLPSGERIYSNLLRRETALAVLDMAAPCDVMIEVFIDGQAYTEPRFLEHPARYGTSEQYIPYVLRTRKPVDSVRDLLARSPRSVENINLKTADSQLRQTLWHMLDAMGTVAVTASSSANIEVSAPHTGKAQAVAWLCKRLGFAMDHVMAAGDSLNDVLLLEQAGVAVAMANGEEAVRQAADFIALSNDEDGLAYAIAHFLGQPGTKER